MTSLVVVTFNSASPIEACLASVLHHTGSQFEVICVDNGSDDGTSELIQRMRSRDERISIIENKSNLGYAAGGWSG